MPKQLSVLFKTSRLRLSTISLFAALVFGLVSPSALAQRRSQVLQNPTSGDPVSERLLLRIVQAEDERRWDNDLRELFRARNANVRSRAALAAGRIGNDAAVPDLVTLLQHDDEAQVRAMAAFALGEIESPLPADALLKSLEDSNDVAVRARDFEALGKIAAALPKEREADSKKLGSAILDELRSYVRRRGTPDRQVVLLALTAVLRAKSENAGPVIAEFLRHADPRIRADAANTLARLKLKDGNDILRKLLLSDPDPVVRANAARVLGATEDKASSEQLLGQALGDTDSRVRISSIRALALLKDPTTATQLLARAEQLAPVRQTSNALGSLTSANANEVIEIAGALGRILQNSNNKRAITWLRNLRAVLQLAAPEVELAFSRVAPQYYQIESNNSLNRILFSAPDAASATESVFVSDDWRRWSSVAQGLGELASTTTNSPILTASIKEESLNQLHRSLSCPPIPARSPRLRPRAGEVVAARCTPIPTLARPDFLRAYAAFKPKDLDGILRKELKESDVVVRGTAADLLGELPPSEMNTRALIEALPAALADRELNDAALSIIDALAKQKSAPANDAIKTALNSSDHLVRRRAVAALKANSAGDLSSRIGTVKTRNTAADYERAIARIGTQVTATVSTTKGSFTLDLLPEAAPLTVDNFVQLAKRKYFNGLTVHRVVPNFVIQDGDPRGDGNGGPGYQIRCEINEAPYDRGALGMALSGKDTGGSQWFVTHSPQPHLDGGYTVFGNVISGMDVVDQISRGDVIKSITILEKRIRH